jgi:hypothetical protein
MEVREMATATIAAPATLHFPQVSTDQISQEELSEFVAAQKTLSKLQQHVDTLQPSLLARLRAGAVVEDGEHTAEVARSVRRSPSWKNVTKRLAKRLGLDGDVFCSRVIARTKPSEAFSLQVN